jgi:hypothetical protein
MLHIDNKTKKKCLVKSGQQRTSHLLHAEIGGCLNDIDQQKKISYQEIKTNNIIAASNFQDLDKVWNMSHLARNT